MNTGTTVDESKLPAAFQRGLTAVRIQVPTCSVLAIAENFAILDIGELSSEDLTLYSQPTARIFARVPLTFPNAAPYGVITAPHLTRKDGKSIERQHLNHANAAPIAAYLGQGSVAFWSWDWSNMPLRRPEDLGALVPWALKRIRQG
jgi:hypothetical protein